MRILTRREDVHCVNFHLLTLAAYAAAFWIATRFDRFGIDSAWERGAFYLAAATMLGWCSGVDVGVNFHNHVHRPIFRIPWLNRWFGRTWTVPGGWPAGMWDYSHTTVHHDHLLGDRDWTLPRRRADGTFENPYRYAVASWPWRYAKAIWRDLEGRRSRAHGKRWALRELGWFAAFASIPCFILDPVSLFFLWIGPMLVANMAVMGPGMYAQHAGCEAESEAGPYRHSNTFLSRFFNLTMFNIGYHIEHHDHPDVHWSALPRLHERLKDELIDHGAHVVPFGYYRGGHLLCQGQWSEARKAEFYRKHPDYEPRETPCTRS